MHISIYPSIYLSIHLYIYIYISQIESCPGGRFHQAPLRGTARHLLDACLFFFFFELFIGGASINICFDNLEFTCLNVLRYESKLGQPDFGFGWRGLFVSLLSGDILVSLRFISDSNIFHSNTRVCLWSSGGAVASKQSRRQFIIVVCQSDRFWRYDDQCWIRNQSQDCMTAHIMLQLFLIFIFDSCSMKQLSVWALVQMNNSLKVVLLMFFSSCDNFCLFCNNASLFQFVQQSANFFKLYNQLWVTSLELRGVWYHHSGCTHDMSATCSVRVQLNFLFTSVYTVLHRLITHIKFSMAYHFFRKSY
jgi:hypothetical protein